MVCTHGNLPLIQVGGHEIAGYDRRWLAEAIEESDHDAGEFARDIAEAVLYYLREIYQGNTVTVPEVESQLRYCLGAIGQRQVGDDLALASPPQHISLTEFAYLAGPGFDIAFFAHLAARLRPVRNSDCRELRCTGLAEAIHVLVCHLPDKQIPEAAREFAQEIVGFVSRAVRRPANAPALRISIS